MSHHSLSTRIIAVVVVFVIASIVYQAITRITPEADLPDTSYSVLEKHRDRLIDHLADIADAIENAG